MFIGHYALALAAKRAAPRTSLGTLFAATSLADLLWPVFLLLGWEQAHVVPGPNPFLTLWVDSSFSDGCSWDGPGGRIDIGRDTTLPGESLPDNALPNTALPEAAWPETAFNASPATPHPVTPHPGTPHPGTPFSGNASLQLVQHVQHPLELLHGVVAVRREPDGTLAQRAHDVGPLQRVVRLDGVRGGEADDRGAVRFGAR